MNKFSLSFIAVTLIMTGCALSVQVSPTATIQHTPFATSSPTAKETATPNISMLQIDGLEIPDPKASNPEFFDLQNPNSPIFRFAKTFGVKSEDVGTLKPEVKTSVDGKQFVFLITGDLAATATFNETSTPLFIAERGENGEWLWSEATPARLYTVNNAILEITMATYSFDTKGDNDPSNDEWINMLENDDFKRLILESGNRIFISGELDTNWIFSNFAKSDWDRVLSDWNTIREKLDKEELPDGFQYNWEAAENLIEFATANGLQVRVQHLAWDSDVPEAFKNYAEEDAKKLLEFIVKTKVIKFGPQVNAWDLPDEVVEREKYNQGFWTGKKLDAVTTVQLVAQFVKEVDPDARLILVGDFVFENFPDPNFDRNYFAFVDLLIEKAVPIDALSNENNLWVRSPIDTEKFQRVVDEAKKRNLQFEGGETTIAMSSVYPNWPNRPAQVTVDEADLQYVQANMYAQLEEIYRTNGINSFGFGNLEDENSWQTRIGYPDSRSSLSPNISGERKPAWYAFMASALKGFK